MRLSSLAFSVYVAVFGSAYPDRVFHVNEQDYGKTIRVKDNSYVVVGSQGNILVQVATQVFDPGHVGRRIYKISGHSVVYVNHFDKKLTGMIRVEIKDGK